MCFSLSMTSQNSLGSYFCLIKMKFSLTLKCSVEKFKQEQHILFLQFIAVMVENCRKVQRRKAYFISTIHSCHGGEFENKTITEFCNKNGFTQNFSSPRSPQQKCVVEKKHFSLQKTTKPCFWSKSAWSFLGWSSKYC